MRAHACTAVLVALSALLAPAPANAGPLVALGTSSDAAPRFAHDGRLSDCNGCHSMHQPVAGDGEPSSMLLGKRDPGSTCLACHATSDLAPSGPHVMTYPIPPPGFPPTQLTPGGDFAYLRKSYSWTGAGGTAGKSPGHRHGHDNLAADFDLDEDRSVEHAPGGSYRAKHMSCISCHDPHAVASSGGDLPASVRSYRLLGGVGYAPRSWPDAVPFSAPAPTAVAPRRYNRSEAETDTRVAYGMGMSEWCHNCHPNVGGLASHQHPAGRQAPLTEAMAATYNAYVATGSLLGSPATSYTSLVPFEEGTDVMAILERNAVTDGSRRGGPNAGTERVMCLTCHRAHASAFDHAGRWSFRATLLTVNGDWPGTDASSPYWRSGDVAGGMTRREHRQAMYGRPATRFAAFQRSLCNKCHSKD